MLRAREENIAARGRTRAHGAHRRQSGARSRARVGEPSGLHVACGCGGGVKGGGRRDRARDFLIKDFLADEYILTISSVMA